MINILDIDIDNAVAFSVSGKVSESDMSLVLDLAKDKTANFGEIVVLEVIESFGGVEISALVEEFRYLREVGMSNIRKVAIVTDKKWIEPIVKIEDKLFQSIEMQCFSLDDQASAIAFLKLT